MRTNEISSNRWIVCLLSELPRRRRGNENGSRTLGSRWMLYTWNWKKKIPECSPLILILTYIVIKVLRFSFFLHDTLRNWNCLPCSEDRGWLENGSVPVSGSSSYWLGVYALSIMAFWPFLSEFGVCVNNLTRKLGISIILLMSHFVVVQYILVCMICFLFSYGWVLWFLLTFLEDSSVASKGLSGQPTLLSLAIALETLN